MESKSDYSLYQSAAVWQKLPHCDDSNSVYDNLVSSRQTTNFCSFRQPTHENTENITRHLHRYSNRSLPPLSARSGSSYYTTTERSAYRQDSVNDIATIPPAYINKAALIIGSPERPDVKYQVPPLILKPAVVKMASDKNGSIPVSTEMRRRVSRRSNNNSTSRVSGEVEPLVVEHDGFQSTEPLTQTIFPFLVVYQLLGYWIDTLIYCEIRTFGCWMRKVSVVLPLFCTLFWSTLNAYLIHFLLSLLIQESKEKGPLSMETVFMIINNSTTILNTGCIIALVIVRTRHRALIRRFDEINKSFAHRLGYRVRARRAILIICGLLTFWFFVVLTCRVTWVLTQNETLVIPGETLLTVLNHASFVLVPTLRVMNFTPFSYFAFYAYVLRSWYETLFRAMMADRSYTKHPLRFYYGLFSELCIFSYELGNYFLYFIPVVLFVNIGVMCFTIYYFSQGLGKAIAFVRVPANFESVLYASFQNMTAVVTIVMTARCGWTANESARKILAASLSSEAETEDDRFQVVRFAHRFTTQLRWGISVWRAFPIERYFLFTVISIIVAYGFLLNRFKPSDSCNNNRTQVEELIPSPSSLTPSNLTFLF